MPREAILHEEKGSYGLSLLEYFDVVIAAALRGHTLQSYTSSPLLPPLPHLARALTIYQIFILTAAFLDAVRGAIVFFLVFAL